MSAPFIQFYIGDYLKETPHLSTEQHGAYFLLLLAMWGAGGHLPNDDAKLARIVHLSTVRWRKIKDDVIEFFEVEEDKITHKRITSDIKKVEKKSEVRASAGRAGGVAKSLKKNKPDLANATDLPKHSSDIRDHISEREDTSSLHSDVCAESQATAAQVPAKADLFQLPIFITIPTNRFATKGEEAPITEAKVAEWQATYPGVDVRQQLLRARQWCIDKPERRKTVKGMHSFINSWLARQQDKGSNNNGYTGHNNGSRLSTAHENLILGAALSAGMVGGGYPPAPEPGVIDGDFDEVGGTGCRAA